MYSKKNMEEKLIRINKVIRALEIPLEKAINFLEKNGIVIENSPNTKINQIAYDILLNRFGNRNKRKLLSMNNSGFTENNSSNFSSSNIDISEDLQLISEALKPYFNYDDVSLLNEIKEHNSIPNFIFEGVFEKVDEKDFGFFINISHKNGSILKYPVSDIFIDAVYIRTTDLVSGKRYIFEATIAKKNQRFYKSNPFLLQAKSENIQEIIIISQISQELKIKQGELVEIKNSFQKAEKDFETKKIEIEEEYEDLLNQKMIKIESKKDELTSLDVKIGLTKNNLQNMENLIDTLKDRVLLCRNLQFINEDDENKYLNFLSAKELNLENHYDFEKDFGNSFSELSEHIHAFLYHKKNLIYTPHQIFNFLTLLRTHDIIVLSGLSGSGKTQIVKAFAEAMGGVAKIIPVKPNWTSSDDLIGYYNPLQMSFLPTPFTEAIVEAINNPKQLYFICLDEMNLARAEYYFADFLSKLEERSKKPEIELYANHEEELFISEFNTLLNLIESSIKGKEIKSWQDFLDNEVARNNFFEMLGNKDNESILQLHAKMKRRLIDILKFPSTIQIPNNVRFIGAINVDETTHYFSPKILDRIHIVKFENPLIFEDHLNVWFENKEYDKELKPVYVEPSILSKREEFPTVNNTELLYVTQKLKEINQKFLIPLNIDFGIRSIRQSLNYAVLNKSTYNYGDSFDISLNTIIVQKVFPRFMFDGSENSKIGISKMEVVKDLSKHLSEMFNEVYLSDDDELEIGKKCSSILDELINDAERNNSQFNFFS
jgi:hypothetical protein